MEVMAKVNIICEICKHRHLLERNTFVDGERIAIICNGCENRIESVFVKPVDRQPDPSLSMGSWGLF